MQNMTKEEKAKLYEPKEWALYVNGQFYATYPSHAAAKKEMHFRIKESYENWDDDTYEIKPVED